MWEDETPARRNAQRALACPISTPHTTTLTVFSYYRGRRSSYLFDIDFYHLRTPEITGRCSDLERQIAKCRDIHKNLTTDPGDNDTQFVSYSVDASLTGNVRATNVLQVKC